MFHFWLRLERARAARRKRAPALPHLHLHHGAHMGRGGRSWFNMATIAAFLAWFGGTGYLLEHYYGVGSCSRWVSRSSAASARRRWCSGFVAKVLMAREAPLDPADYDMTGVLGKLSMPIRAGGTGELIYSQEGTRRVAGARSEDGAAIPKGSGSHCDALRKGHRLRPPVGRFRWPASTCRRP